MYKCLFCDNIYETIKQRASHISIHQEWKDLKKYNEDKKFEAEKTYVHSCLSCGKHVKDIRTLLAHTAKCSSAKKDKNAELENLKDEIIYYYNLNFSLLEIYNKLKSKMIYCSYNTILKKLPEWDIIPRSLAETCNLETVQNKRIKSCMAKYGAPNVLSKGTNSYIKKNITVLEKYGVENVFQHSEIMNSEKINNTYLVKYDMTRIEYLRLATQNAWAILTEDERKCRIHNAYKKTAETMIKNNTVNSITRSKLELLVENILINNKISFTIQKKIYDPNINKIFYYDFYIQDKILLEINGDYWHANPSIYKADDVIRYPGHYKTAKDKWDADNIKKQVAIDNNYNIHYIWESDLLVNPEEVILGVINNDTDKNKKH